MSNYDSVKNFSSKILEITNQMKVYGNTTFDQQIVEKKIDFLVCWSNSCCHRTISRYYKDVNDYVSWCSTSTRAENQ